MKRFAGLHQRALQNGFALPNVRLIRVNQMVLASVFFNPQSLSPRRRIGVKEMGNGRFLCENVVVQPTTPHHVIPNNMKDLSKTHRFG